MNANQIKIEISIGKNIPEISIPEKDLPLSLRDFIRKHESEIAKIAAISAGIKRINHEK